MSIATAALVEAAAATVGVSSRSNYPQESALAAVGQVDGEVVFSGREWKRGPAQSTAVPLEYWRREY